MREGAVAQDLLPDPIAQADIFELDHASSSIGPRSQYWPRCH